MNYTVNSTAHGGHPYYECHQVSVICPVQATTLGYYPNRGINIFFTVAFGLAGLTTVVLGAWKRTWSYMSFITLGCMLELAGYAARIPLTDNPWNQKAFETQIVAIILAPTIICISIYLTLKHICLSINPNMSRFKPKWYPFIFVPLDVSCLFVQAIGGSIAASAGYTNTKLLAGGNHAIIAGITLQVVVLSFFGGACLDYFLRVRAWIGSGEATPQALELWHNKRFRLFVYAVAGAYGGILIRCIYRIAEMAGGWGNRIMQDQPSFIVLEGFMILIPVSLLAAFPPGILFPEMAIRMAQDAKRRFSRRKKGSVTSNQPSETTPDQPTAGEKMEDSDGHAPTQSVTKSEEVSERKV